MIALEQILAEWQEDSIIRKDDYENASMNTPKMHSKYLEYLSLTKLRLKKAEFDQKTLLKDKYLYYEGKMSEEDLNERGWKPDPFDGLNPKSFTKATKDTFYNGDTEMQDSEMRIQMLKTTVETLTEIVDNLKWRHQTIGNIIRWRSFEAGM
jgi:hypothetical protein|tara:strand:+ start:5460 stop:5915 length:456 start_codon:yes stop_codon:yes gene_type:complete